MAATSKGAHSPRNHPGQCVPSKGARMRRLKLASVVLAVLVLTACPNNPNPQTLPPGALNQFDATSYTSLMGAQAVLNSVKADINKLPPEAKPALNKAIAAYNIADA